MRPSSERGIAWGPLACLALFAAALVLRLPAFTSAVIDPDEGLYVVQAEAWLRGGWPYLAVWDMHPPGAPALLTPAHALVPDPVLALRLTGVLAVGTTACLLRAIAIRLGAAPATGLAAGLLYIGHSVTLGGLATNTEILFAPFVALTALILLAEALRTAPPRVSRVLLAGLSAGIALWVKQLTALESSALWFTLAVVAMASRRAGIGRLAVLAAAFAAGAGAPSIGVGLGYWLAGHGADWWQGNFLAPLAYVGAPGLYPGARVGLLLILPTLAPLFVPAAGLALPDAAGRRALRLLLPWTAAAFLAMAAPGRFYEHYFLILLSPLSLLAAFGLAAILRFAVRPAAGRAAFVAMLAVLVAIPVATMLLPRLAYGLGLRGEDPVRAVARVATANLAPGEALYVVNWHVITYALAGRAPPTRYAFPEHLIGRNPALAGGDLPGELARVLALPPGVIVMAPTRWRAISEEARATIEATLRRDYRLVETVPDPAGPVEVWRRR
jgi:4-amino-4-deoxy-L-arabinose transferase-like glycosyltransferase